MNILPLGRTQAGRAVLFFTSSFMLNRSKQKQAGEERNQKKINNFLEDEKTFYLQKRGKWGGRSIRSDIRYQVHSINMKKKLKQFSIVLTRIFYSTLVSLITGPKYEEEEEVAREKEREA